MKLFLNIPVTLQNPLEKVAKELGLTPQQALLKLLAERVGVEYQPRFPGRSPEVLAALKKAARKKKP